MFEEQILLILEIMKIKKQRFSDSRLCMANLTPTNISGYL